MDLEKVKKNYEWDPLKGDYTKLDVYEERRLLKKKEIRTKVFTVLYVAILIISLIIAFLSFN